MMVNIIQTLIFYNIVFHSLVDRFMAMKACKDSYYIIIVEDTSVGQVIASGTLAIEQKFIHTASKVR